MSPIMIGLALGLLLGIAQFVALQKVAASQVKASGTPETAQKVRILKAISWIDLALLPALGGLFGMMLTDGGTAP